MRFGLCTGDPALIERLPALGYDYAEIGSRVLLPFDSDGEFAPVRDRLRATGVPIEALSGFVPGSVKVVGPEVDWAGVRRYLETTIGRAAEVGVRVINWGSAESRRVPPGWPTSRAWEQLERAAGLVAELAARADVTVVVEAVNPRETNILYYLTDALQLVETIDQPSLKLIVDWYHCVKQNEPVEHVARVAPAIAHAHTSDDERRFPSLEGGWDQRPFLQALHAAGYDDRLSFEVRNRYGEAYPDVARESVARMRALAAAVDLRTG